MLPKPGGTEVLEQPKNDTRTANIPVVVLSGLSGNVSSFIVIVVFLGSYIVRIRK
jgi:hypothetical protein